MRRSLSGICGVVGVAAVLIFPPAAPASGQARASRAVHGVVLDSAGAPVGAVEVRLLVGGAVADSARTATDGQFRVATEASGMTELFVRRLGFQPRTIPVVLGDASADSMRIVLGTPVARLEELRVEAERSMGGDWLRGFNQRKATNSFGRYLTRDSVVARHVLHASDLLRRYPAARVILLRDGRFIVRMRSCMVPPLLWVDGVRVPQAELDEVTQADDIAGMEVYASMAGVPAQFMDRSNGGCGTIVVWTRTR